MGEMADFALDDVAEFENMRDLYHNGHLSAHESLSYGFEDPTGAYTGFAGDSRDYTDVGSYESLKSDIENGIISFGSSEEFLASCSSSPKKQRAIKKTNPEEDQNKIVEASKYGNNIKIEARAGCGKTTTLKKIAESNVKPSLYIAFNKNMAKEASEKFPSHVKCMTGHALAYSMFGSVISHKLSRPQGQYKNVAGTGSEVAKYYGLSPVFRNGKCVLTSAYLGLLAISTVSAFEYSKSKKIKRKHVPLATLEKKVAEFEGVDIKDIVDKVFDTAKKLWEDRKNPESIVLASHDTYFKLFQLSKPVLDYDAIYLDEAQDSNDAMMDIINRQTCQVIMVGDSYQSIYGFRGATSALDKFDADEYVLNGSFRFGDLLANKATNLLSDDKGVFGLGSTSVNNANDVDISVLGKDSCLIFRTNMALVSTAIDIISNGMNVDMPNTYDLRSAIDSAIELKNGNINKVKHSKLLQFSSWEEFESAKEDDQDLKSLYNMVSGDEKQLFRKLAVLNKNDPSKAQITLRTAHGCKGLEWDTTVIMNDFSDDPATYEKDRQESNLMYVALTRAKNTCYYNDVVDYIRC